MITIDCHELVLYEIIRKNHQRKHCEGVPGIFSCRSPKLSNLKTNGKHSCKIK